MGYLGLKTGSAQVFIQQHKAVQPITAVLQAGQSSIKAPDQLYSSLLDLEKSIKQTQTTVNVADSDSEI